MITNPFKVPLYRKAFDNLLAVYARKGEGLFYTDGSRCKGNSIAVEFWRGFDDVNGVRAKQYNSRDERNSLGWAYYRAGRAIAKSEGKP